MSSLHNSSVPGTTIASSRMIALVRLALAFSAAALITASDGARPDALNSLLLSYTLYSAALYALTAIRRLPFLFSHDYWIDLVYCVLLILLTGGVNSPVVLFMLFPIHIASFRRGFSAGIQVTVSAVTVLVIMALAAPDNLGPEWSARFVRLTGLFFIGVLLAYSGGHEFRLKHRLAVVKEITRLSNPRFGVDALVSAIMRRLLALYSATGCLLVIAMPDASDSYLYRVTSDHPDREARPEAITPSLQAKLTDLPDRLAVVYGERPRYFWHRRQYYTAFDLRSNGATTKYKREARTLANILAAGSYLSVPICFNDQAVGRLYLLADRNVFDSSDIEFILQVVNQVIPVVENIRLVDRLASIAAEEERKKIARNLHDSVIQPYIGLQLGLTGVRRKLSAGEEDVTKEVTKDIDTLMEVISNEVVQLRSFVRVLKEGGIQQDNLIPAVRRFAEKFSTATGIAVRVIATESLSLNDRLAGEVFQMVVEGLSNIRRHTESTMATIIMARRDETLNVRIEDNGASKSKPGGFTPRSLAERARALGGDLRVRQHANITMVDINIQL